MKRFGITTLSFTQEGDGMYTVIGLRPNGKVVRRTFSYFDNANRQAKAWDSLQLEDWWL